ncbi:MAG TPA: hypothetical protein VD704_04700 [Gaiellaceae bacterium]|nr:hypothetical protein [Gaiellaceae bacterium]
MALAGRVDEIVRGLPRDWERARLELTIDDGAEADRAAVILAPATPGRSGRTFLLHVGGGLASPTLARRVLSRLDEEGIRARLALVDHEARAAAASGASAAPARERLSEAWDELVRRLPPDWTDLYAEVELDSTDYLDRGALLLAPVNPARYGGTSTFRFRAARSKGYGAAPGMARRSLERLDEEGIGGRLRALRVLSDSSSVFTQGPVWRVGGRSV